MAMYKKILCCLLAVALAIGQSVSCFAARFSVPENLKLTDSTNVELLYENPVITQDDLESNFINYALGQAKVSLSEMECLQRPASLSNETANVVGMVLDSDTDIPVSHALISMNEQELVYTNDDGRFQIGDVPTGLYNWGITAKDYQEANYLNYSVDAADGTTIFTFYICKDKEKEVDREQILNIDEEQTIPIDPIKIDGDDASIYSMSSVPSVRDTVKVYYNGKTKSVDRETYIYTVLSSELYGTSWYSNKGLTENQIMQLYCAQAIAANTFLEYSLSVTSNHPGKDYDVCSTTNCQVYDPTKVTQAAINATANTFYTVNEKPTAVIVFYEASTSSYDYVWGAFFSSCGNQGTKSYGNSQPALVATSCTDIASGAGGHRYGLCQMGAATLAKNGYDAEEILLTYYYGCDTEFCVLDS